jgi:hypothetical protein
MDELIALSKACRGVSDDDDEPLDCGVRSVRRLRARTARSYDELAAIEAAIDGRPS